MTLAARSARRAADAFDSCTVGRPPRNSHAGTEIRARRRGRRARNDVDVGVGDPGLEIELRPTPPADSLMEPSRRANVPEEAWHGHDRDTESDMKLVKRTVLITGGTSGIGLELARQLLQRGNIVIVTGRDQHRLDAADAALPGVHTFQSDVSDPGAIALLRARGLAAFPALDVLVNNAGIMRNLDLNQ